MKPPRHAQVPKVAFRNPEFLDSLAARPIRILGEYLDPLVKLRKEGVGDTIVMFGSARIEPRDCAQAHLRRLQRDRKRRLTGEQSAKLRERLRGSLGAGDVALL
jgi:hypothetical protein